MLGRVAGRLMVAFWSDGEGKGEEGKMDAVCSKVIEVGGGVVEGLYVYGIFAPGRPCGPFIWRTDASCSESGGYVVSTWQSGTGRDR